MGAKLQDWHLTAHAGQQTPGSAACGVRTGGMGNAPSGSPRQQLAGS